MKITVNIRRNAVEFNPDEYKKFKQHCNVQKLNGRRPPRVQTAVIYGNSPPKRSYIVLSFLHIIEYDKRLNTKQLGKITNYVTKNIRIAELYFSNLLYLYFYNLLK